MITEQNRKTIDRLIQQGRSFALWRIPGEANVRFRMQTQGNACPLDRIESLNGRSGFVVAPFHINGEHPLVLIEPDVDSLDEAERISSENPLPEVEIATSASPIPVPDEAENHAGYARCFRRFTEPLLKGIQDKLVLSRREIRPRRAGFSPAEAFRQAAERYTRSYVYLVHTPRTGTWLGATPEILLAGEAGSWQTVALAGTQPIREGHIPQRWDDKNWREQQLVAYYIRRQLNALGIHPDEMGPYAIRAGEVSHLKSDFRFTLPDTLRLGDLLARLHPTPAVCGLPEEEAYRFILANEGYDRSYYSGFIGAIDREGETALYVNLRCMHIAPHAFTLYAGGGLLASSELESEWQETRDKMETMGRLLP